MSEFKTKPFKHQEEEYDRTRSFPFWAHFWQQGTGKTWIAMNTAAHLLREGKIRSVFVLAPNGVHRNWVSDEIPAHWPDDVPVQTFCWQSAKASTKWHQRAAQAVMDLETPALVAMSYDAFMTDRGRKFADKFLGSRPCLYVLDESSRIKTASSKRTRSVVLSGKKAPYRRILSGTPVTQSPFDVYPQMKFVSESFWRDRGFASYEAFKTYFGVWVERCVEVEGEKTRKFPQLVTFRNLEELKGTVKTASSRVTKDDVLDLPPKLYTKRYFDLTSQQREVYDKLRDEFVVFLDSGEMVTAPLVVVRLLRLAQVTSGYFPSDDLETVHEIPGGNPRVDALVDTVEDWPGQCIVWGRFTRTIDQVCARLGKESVRYDGLVSEADRAKNKEAFQRGDAKYFVAKPSVGGTGLTLVGADKAVYVENAYNLEHRLQSEDRCHRIGQTKPVSYVDIIAENTVDKHIVKKLLTKIGFANMITGDEVRQWL